MEKSVYFSNEQETGLSAYAIQTDGTLKLIEVEASQVPREPADKLSASFCVGTPEFVFIGIRDKSEENRDRIVSYQIQDDLSVEQVSTTPFPSKIPWGAEVSPCEKYLFVTSSTAKKLHAYKIKEDGTLKEVTSLVLKGKSNSLAIRSAPKE